MGTFMILSIPFLIVAAVLMVYRLSTGNEEFYAPETISIGTCLALQAVHFFGFGTFGSIAWASILMVLALINLLGVFKVSSHSGRN